MQKVRITEKIKFEFRMVKKSVPTETHNYLAKRGVSYEINDGWITVIGIEAQEVSFYIDLINS